MRPETLVISGWGPYKGIEEVDFNAFQGRGLFLVTGATGAGKTTLFDAITYALYGGLSGEMREKNSVRSDFADPETPTFVELIMQHAGREYRIRRNPEYQRPRKRGKEGTFTKEKENAILYLPDGSIIEGTKEVNAKVQEILVLDYAQFKQITMIAQGEFARLLTAPPKEKTKIFRDIFDTGIYEKFAQNLRVKSNQLYGKVMEQKNKLEEDVRLLLEGSGREEQTAALRELTDSDNWNYEAILAELKALSGASVEIEKALQEKCETLSRKNDKLTAEVTEKKLENEQIEKLIQAQKTLALLKEQEADIERQKAKLKRAKDAATLKTERIKEQSALDNQKRAIDGEQQAKKKLEALATERKNLQVFADKREELDRYLEVCRKLVERQERIETLLKEHKKALTEWDNAKKIFLERDEKRQLAQGAYQEAERKYRFAAAGVAAKMLVAGEPCPVCGSKEHPKPAVLAEDLPSEEQLKHLKEEADQADEKLLKAQEKSAAAKSFATAKEQELSGEQEILESLKKEEMAGIQTLLQEKIFGEQELGQADYETKAGLIRSRTDRLSQVEGKWAAAKEQCKVAEAEVTRCNEVEAACRLALGEALKKAGFASEEECEEHTLSARALTALEEELAAYQEKKTAAASVCEHLEKSLQNREKHDLEPLLLETQECRAQITDSQKEWKQAHAFGAEVKKTATQFAQKQEKIAAAKEEYGFVKDLDNLASGNNAKRLVFEQYVLAGYFEEILRAANLRFSQMTGGRYEMYRIEEAEDGRTKDSLDIQVMDYYTGKARSVKTLSGGESFKASLSLALGMSDVIQATNGGIRVETLFIDEGFGALDEESLDQACETLMGLVEHDRLIGIISHVAELRERIDSQIVVEKTNSGSRVRIRV